LGIEEVKRLDRVVRVHSALSSLNFTIATSPSKNVMNSGSMPSVVWARKICTVSGSGGCPWRYLWTNGSLRGMVIVRDPLEAFWLSLGEERFMDTGMYNLPSYVISVSAEVYVMILAPPL
jgi:hypothetical protein